MNFQMAKQTGMPVDVTKILFAEDLINFVMQYYDDEFQRFSPHYEFIYKAFNNTTQNAINAMVRTTKFQQDISRYMQNISAINRNTCIDFGQSLSQKYFPNGFNSNNFHNFLSYCVHLTIAALYFYNYGVHDAPVIASNYIFSLWMDYDMSNGGWDTLNSIAETYASMSMEQLSRNLESRKILSSDQDTSGELKNIKNTKKRLFSGKGTNFVSKKFCK